MPLADDSPDDPLDELSVRRERKVRRPALLTAAAAAVVVLVIVGALTGLYGGGGGGGSAGSDLALVTAVDTVVVLPDGTRIEGARGVELPDGTIIRTGPHGRATIAGVHLGPDTEAVIRNGRVRVVGDDATSELPAGGGTGTEVVPPPPAPTDGGTGGSTGGSGGTTGGSGSTSGDSTGGETPTSAPPPPPTLLPPIVVPGVPLPAVDARRRWTICCPSAECPHNPSSSTPVTRPIRGLVPRIRPISAKKVSPKRAAAVVVATLVGAVTLSACLPPPPPPPPSGTVPIMGPAQIDAGRLASWFHGRSPQPGGAYAATVSVETLATYYLQEGAAEGVRGDVAFIQAIVETGWFRFGGSVPAWKNNFAGIGATDTNPAPAAFPDARTGVRGADPAPSCVRRRGGDRVHGATAAQPVRRPALQPRVAEGQGADLEPDGERQLGDVDDVRRHDPQALQRSPRLALRRHRTSSSTTTGR